MGRKLEETKSLAQQLLAQRLKKLGSISLTDAWKTCDYKINYGLLQPIFKEIMMQLVADGKADIIRPGIYWIHKN